jgi:hypothetical protein
MGVGGSKSASKPRLILPQSRLNPRDPAVTGLIDIGGEAIISSYERIILC